MVVCRSGAKVEEFESVGRVDGEVADGEIPVGKTKLLQPTYYIYKVSDPAMAHYLFGISPYFLQRL
jgi:hypothetical protein